MKRTALLLLIILSMPFIGVFIVHGSIIKGNTELTLNSLGVKENWYIEIDTSMSNPIIADLNDDGKAEIVLGSNEGFINCFNHKGRKKWIYDATNFPVDSTGTVADVDNDNKLEVIIGAGVISPYIYCFEDTGALKWRTPFNTMISNCGSVVGDINNDDELEIVSTAMIGNVSCMSKNGELLWHFKKDEISSSPVLIDCDNDFHLETIIQSPAMVYCLNSDGDVKWNHSIAEGWSDRNSPALADFELDDEVEIILCSNDTVYCLNSNGTLRWTYLTEERWINSPVIADLEGNGDLEVVIQNRYRILCLDDEGNKKWSFEPDIWASKTTPALADLNGDNEIEIVAITDDNKTICLDSTGSLIWEIELANLEFYKLTSPILYDLNRNGILDIIISSRNGIFCLELTGTQPVKSSVGNRAPWRCYMGSCFRTGHRDSDSDFLDDQTELFYKTDIFDPDTDDDTVCDGMEVFAGTNPNNKCSKPFYARIVGGFLPLIIGLPIIIGTVLFVVVMKKEGIKKRKNNL